MVDAKTPYFAVKSLLVELLELDMETSHQEREHALFQLFTDNFILQNLAMLNDILILKVFVSVLM